MSRAFSSGSVGFVLVCANLLPVTSHFMTPSTTHIGFTGSSPVQEIQGNPAHWYCLFVFDKVLHWACAVILRTLLRQLGILQDQAVEATDTYKFLSTDSVHGNPQHLVLLLPHFDTVLYWEYAVSSEPFCGNSASNRTRYSRPPAPTNFYHIDSVHGNPEHSVLLLRCLDTVLHWAYAVLLRTLL